MKRRIVLWAFVSALLFVNHAISSLAISNSYSVANTPKLVTRQVSAQAFSSISLSSPFSVQYTISQVDSPKLSITAPADCIDFLKVEVENGTLKLYYDFGDNGALRNGQTVTQLGKDHSKTQHNITGTLVQITAPAINSFNLLNGGDMDLVGDFTVKEIFSASIATGSKLTHRGVITVGGSVSLQANAGSSFTTNGITCQYVTIEASSAANVEWRGSLVVKRDAKFVLNSAAHAKGESLVCHVADISVFSGARCEVQRVAANNLTGHAENGGVLLLSGSCNNAELYAGQGGKIDTYTMQAQNVTAQANTGSDVYAPSAENIIYSHDTGGRVRWRTATKVHEQ